MKARALHPWRVSHAQAVGVQEALRPQLVVAALPSAPRRVAGADVAYSRRTHRVYAAVVVVELPSLETVETVGVVRTATFPYVPGLLSFREAPPLLDAFEQLAQAPDLVVFDGQGLAHPRRFGLACHVGLLLDVPSVGCAKTRLAGEHDPVPDRRWASTPLRMKGETVGAAIRTREGVKPVFVSPGHRSDVRSAVALLPAVTGRWRLPEPQRRAHQATAALHARDRGRPAVRVRTYPNFVPRRPR